MSLLKQLPKPDLDDKTFAQLVDEALRLIPRYGEEWTDHNLSDPGITIIDLFAWLTETSLYRLNLITDRHRLKYLKLLGCRPMPAMPATVDLSFKPQAARHLDAGTVVSTTLTGREVFYELSEEISVAPVSLLKVIVDELTGGVFDRTDANEKGDMFYAPFGLNVRKECALCLGLSGPSGNLDFMFCLYEKDLIGPGKHGVEPDYRFDNAVFRWEMLTSSGWSVIEPKSDDTDGFKKSGRIVFRGMDAGEWKPASDIPVWKDPRDQSYYWLRCVVEKSFFEYPPRIETIMLNTARAVEGRTYENEAEWTGTGLPAQTFTLGNSPVADKTVDIIADGMNAEEKDDLDGSGPSDYHFVLDRERGVVIFGDGVMGKVPPSGCSIKVAGYRTCSGKEGSVPAGCDWKVDAMGDIVIHNSRPSTGGTGAEPIDDAILRFNHDLRVPYTTVTSYDFEYIAVNTPGLRVAKAKAIPNYDPAGKETPGLVTIVILPFTPLDYFENPPDPSDGFKQAVCRHLNAHRLIGTELCVSGPLYVRVTVSLSLVVSAGFREGDVARAVTERLNTFIHPVKGGKTGDGWPIGRNVYRSEIFEIVEGIDGVACVTRLFLSGDKGSSPDREGNLMLPAPALTASVYSGKHSVVVIKEIKRCKGKKNANDQA